jgi:hypothetical protein
MKRALIMGLAAVACAACGVQAAYSATTAVPVRVGFTQLAGVDLGSTLTLPSVSIGAVSNSATTSAAAVNTVSAARGVSVSGVSAAAVGNTQLTIRGQPGDVVSTTVPESFTVVRSGGQETLIVKTNTNAEYQLGSGGVALGGDAILNGDTMSVDVGGRLALASAQNLVPGPYEGMLVVVVQYN